MGGGAQRKGRSPFGEEEGDDGAGGGAYNSDETRKYTHM